MFKEIGIKLGKEHWYQQVLKSVETSQEGKVTILWKQHVQTDRTIPSNKPDIIICVNEKKNLYVNRCCNFRRQKYDKEAQRILKYKDIKIEIKTMWNVKTNLIPVTIGATGTMSKSFRKCLSNILGKHKNQGNTGNSHIGHGAHTLESINVKVQYNRFNIGASIICTMNSNY
jgi:hypothetical protein